MSEKLSTGAEITWCPGCYNFMLLNSVQKALDRLMDEGLRQEDVVMSTGIGCHGKMFDYLNVGGVYSLHGRVLPTCVGMKMGNPNLTVLGFGGDGDTFAEGISHFVHAARYNVDMTMVVHNNQVFALTTGQGTPTSEQGFKTKSQPLGVASQPLNPLEIALDAGASFIARVYPKNVENTAEVIQEAIEHDGFAFVDVAMPCLIFHQDQEELEEGLYKLEEHDPTDKEKAREKIEEWNYDPDSNRTPIGVFYREEKETLTDKFPQEKELKEKGMGWYQVER